MALTTRSIQGYGAFRFVNIYLLEEGVSKPFRIVYRDMFWRRYLKLNAIRSLTVGNTKLSEDRI